MHFRNLVPSHLFTVSLDPSASSGTGAFPTAFLYLNSLGPSTSSGTGSFLLKYFYPSTLRQAQGSAVQGAYLRSPIAPSS
ncbi:MAG: hypothetical protein NTZ69_14475 [Bacteroidia bacterium]|nr:hypothetical protein [Bacteroidia bacterium]